MHNKVPVFFVDFLDCCLSTEPLDRWTAKQLLAHPFINAGPARVSDPECRLRHTTVEVLPANNAFMIEKEREALVEAREVELKEIVSICKMQGVRYNKAKDFNAKRVHERLAGQLGLPADVVRDTFCPKRVRSTQIQISPRTSFFKKLVQNVVSPSHMLRRRTQSEQAGKNAFLSSDEIGGDAGSKADQFAKITS